MSVYLFERIHPTAENVTVSPTFGRVSKIVFMLDSPLVVGGGLRNRSEPLGAQQ